MSATITQTLNCPMCGAEYHRSDAACFACGEELRTQQPPTPDVTWQDVLMCLAVLLGVHTLMVVIIFVLMHAVR